MSFPTLTTPSPRFSGLSVHFYPQQGSESFPMDWNKPYNLVMEAFGDDYLEDIGRDEIIFSQGKANTASYQTYRFRHPVIKELTEKMNRLVPGRQLRGTSEIHSQQKALLQISSALIGIFQQVAQALPQGKHLLADKFREDFPGKRTTPGFRKLEYVERDNDFLGHLTVTPNTETPNQ